MSRTPTLPGFAPALGRAVQEALREGVTLEDIETLTVSGAASLRGIERLTGLETLILEHPASLRPLRWHPKLSRLSIIDRGSGKTLVSLEPLQSLPALRELLLSDLRLQDLEVLATCGLRTMALRSCVVPVQRLRPPASLVQLDLDGTAGLTLHGVCPELRLVDLWGTSMEPVPWVAQQPAIEELWLVGCSVPTLDPLLAMPRPPTWIFMNGDVDSDVERHRATIAELETRGARFALGNPHELGIWIPSWKQVSEREEEPLYLSPGWPRRMPD
jgi:hypothetical protein